MAQGEHSERSTRWVKLDGSPGQDAVFSLERFRAIVESLDPPPLENISFPDPSSFLAGGIHRCISLWEKVLARHQGRDLILKWLREGVNVMDFATRFKGNFGRSSYDCDFPPPKVFGNLENCSEFVSFISSSLMERIRMGAVKVWGKVGKTDPPYLVLPLTVEPSQPRLCLDARFLDLWLRDSPFSLDRLTDVRSYVYQNSFMTKCDDKSGYDHVLLTESSQQYFGFQWAGW